MTDAEVFDLYVAHGVSVRNFAEHVGKPTGWLAKQIAELDPDCPDPQQAARQIMRYVADCLAGDEHETDRGKIVCRSHHGAYARHFYTDRSTGLSVSTDVCVRCGEPRPKSTWTTAGKITCPGGNQPGMDVRRSADGTPKTALCSQCGRWVTVRLSRPRNAWIMRTHYVKEAK